jgi:diguanylate cyclase (GGDEF)-like protein/PAS domain S-box-containing protein
VALPDHDLATRSCHDSLAEESMETILIHLTMDGDRSVDVVATDGPVEALFGWMAAELVDGSIQLLDQFHPDDADVVDQLLQYPPDDPSEWRNARIRKADGRVLCVVIAHQTEPGRRAADITWILNDAKQLPRTLPDAGSVTYLQAIVENTDDYIYFKDRHHVFTGASQTLVSLCEPAAHWSDLVGVTDYDVFPEAYADYYYRLEKQVFAGLECAHEIQPTLTTAGQKGWVDNRKYPLKDDAGNIIGLYGIARDVSDLIKTQLALGAERDYSRRLLDTVEAIIVALDREGRVTLINRRGCAVLGYTPEELVGLKWFDTCLLNNDDLPAIREMYRKALANNVLGAEYYENPIRTRAGEIRDIAWHNSILRDNEGRVIGTLSAGNDISDRKELARRIEKVATHVSGFLYQYQQWPDGRSAFTYASSGIEKIYGTPPDAVVDDASKVFAAIHAADRQRVVQSIADSFQSLRVWHEIYRVNAPDGRSRWVEGEATPEAQGDGSVVWHGYIGDITENKVAADALAESEQRFRAIFSQAGIGIALLSPDGRWRQVNDRLCAIVGYSRDELLRMSFQDVTHPEDLAENLELLEKMLSGASDGYAMDKRYRHKDGHAVWVRVTVSLVRDEYNQPKYFIGIAEDIEDRKLAEDKLREAAAVFTSAGEGVAITDRDATILDVNDAFTRITGYSREEVIGCNCRILQSGRHAPAFFQDLWSELTRTGSWRGQIWNRTKAGDIYPENLTISAVRSDTGEVTGYVGVFADITILKNTEARLEHLAHHDPLTDLPNRLLFQDRLEQSLTHAKRRGTKAAIVFIDLDRFKVINDTFGHTVGDALLVAVAKRLREAVRADDTVARLSGDEFCLILNEILSAEAVTVVVDKLLDSFSRPFEIDGQRIHATLSIGVAIYPEDGGDADSVLGLADAAMYLAKDEGRNTYRFCSGSLQALTFERTVLENALRLGLERDEFQIVYQPQVSMATGQMIGAEALLRWSHPERGAISPAVFIPLAEKSGFIRILGKWVMLEATRQWKQWLEAGYQIGRLSVNVSGPQLYDLGWLAWVEDCLAVSRLEPRYLALEVTETFLMKDADQTLRTLARLREIGVEIAIDDFGTGYSSLSYLNKFPIDRLKIDQSFVHDIPDHKNGTVIVKTIIAMSEALNLDVIAEGVEAEAQAAFLTENGCSDAQGYHFSRPLTAVAMEKWLRDNALP